VQGTSSGSGGFFAVEAVAPGLVPQDSVFALLAEHREELFGPQMWADLFAEDGRPSVPGPVMGAAMVLQALYGCSDRVAAERLTYDLRWKLAVGLGVDEVPFHYSCFCYWRARIAASARPDRLAAAVAQVVAESGVLKGLGKRVVDSTVLFDAVARQSTIEMLVWQISKVRRVLPQLEGFVDARPGRAWYASRSRPDIDWSDQQAKDDLVSVLVNDALAICAKAAQVIAGLPADTPAEDRERMQDTVGLLALLAGQDVEPAEGSDGTDGRWRIAQKVAPDRVISTVDTDARHARKSRAAKADGYKGHLVAEPTTGLVTAAKVTKAAGQGSADADAGKDLLTSDEAFTDGQVEQVYGDSAYASTTLLATLAQAGVQAVVKPRPLPTAVPGGYCIDDFTPHLADPDPDPDADRPPRVTAITCPGGFTLPASGSGRVDFTARCARCIVKDQCTTSATGRTITLDADALLRRDHRAQATSTTFTTEYRKTRPMAERGIAWMVRQLRRLPYRGVTKNNTAWQTSGPYPVWWRVR